MGAKLGIVEVIGVIIFQRLKAFNLAFKQNHKTIENPIKSRFKRILKTFKKAL